MARSQRRQNLYIEGLEQLIDDLGNMTNDAIEALKEGASEGAGIVLYDARSGAPVDQGDLKNALRKVQTGKRSRKKTGYKVEVGPMPGKWHGAFPELGTAKMPAKPFIRPAYDKNKERIKEIMTQKLNRVIGGR